MTKKNKKPAPVVETVTIPVETPKPWSLDRAHEWTHDGDKVLILKCVKKDGSSYGDFKWPLTVGATVEAPDWNTSNGCGGALHGWPWGLGIGDGKRPDFNGIWIVFAVKRGQPIVGNLEGRRKCKVQRAVIRYVGGWRNATKFVLSGQMALVFESSAATSGNYSSAATSGYSSSASANGIASAAVACGLDCKVSCGPYGIIAMAFHNGDRVEMRCAEVGCGDGSDGKLKANVWYKLHASGKFIEA